MIPNSISKARASAISSSNSSAVAVAPPVVLAERGDGRDGETFARRGQDIEGDILVTLDEVLHGSTRTINLQRTDPRTGKSTTQTLRVKIPPGVREAQLIRLAGKGQEGVGGGDPGNLYLRVKFAKHPDFRCAWCRPVLRFGFGAVGSGVGRHRPNSNS